MEDKKRIVYHIVPGDGPVGWDVKRDSEHQAIMNFRTKGDAVHYGRGLAKGEHDRGGLGQLKIHDHLGHIEKEWTYGEDPRNIPG